MDKRIKNIYLVIKNNKVLACESNLKDLLNTAPDALKVRKYDYWYRKFNESNYFEFEYNKDYILQKIEYKADGLTSAK